ncbi:MAG: asparagine synthase (glutamine-hydrolyzing), partial [Planctomycetaceae bacterium]|nr:asparagine synthase (glutamine-hydrolyzing) [Planctomycetaceae bacterium]
APVDGAGARAALRQLEHRGPDGEGVWTRPGGASPHVLLGHRRLSILDLSGAAAQPMETEDRRLVVTYNGEIYNFVEVREELAALGRRFRSTGDTEVLLHAYREWGPACLDRFNGMFAFAVWDEERRTLFAARDRFGEKPFHYALDPATGRFAFASEVKALAALPWVDLSLDDRALYRFAVAGELAGSGQTLWRGVRRLPAAHRLLLRWTGEAWDLRMERWWDVDLARTSDLPLEEAARRFREVFEDGIRLRLRSDVPVGTSLSGGLDSSAVVCQIHALGAAGGQKAFTARMTDPSLDEGRHVAEVLRRTGVEGHEVWPSAAVLREVFPRFCRHMEEPFRSTSQFAQHLVMRLAAENGVTVLLDGQGADEMLAGYEPYQHVLFSALAEEGRFGDLYRESRSFRARHSRPFPLSLRAALGRAFPGLRTIRRGIASRAGEGRGARSPWGLAEGFTAAHGGEDFPGETEGPRDLLTRKLHFDSTRGPLQELLRYGDRNSMAFSRELRQPFLDHRLAEFLFSLPREHKLRGGESKRVQRLAFRGLVPDSILDRKDKLGYRAPWDPWARGEIREWVIGEMEQAASVLGARVRPDAMDAVRAALLPGDRPLDLPLMAWMSLGEGLAAMASVRR